MCELSIKQAQLRVDEWIQYYGLRYFNPLTNLSILMEEVGELSSVMSRKYVEQSFKPGDSDNLDEEFADILWVLLCISRQTETDPTTAFMKSIEKKTNRDNKRHINNPKLT